MWRVCVYTIVLVVCSLSGIQGQQRINPTEETVVHLWAEYLELILPDYYMITSQHFPDIEKVEDTNSDRFIEGIWCLHYMNPFYGTFYYPNGTEVAVYTGTFNFARTENDYTGPDPIYQTNEQLTYTILLRDEDSTTPITSDYEGLYKCIIDDRTLVVGVYDTSTYNNNTGPEAGDMSLSLISTPRYVDPPVFNLRFNVTNGPPTDVTCTGPNSFNVDDTSDDLSREVVNVGTATMVTVTVRMREEGIYQCTVSNARVEDGTINGVTATVISSSLTVTVSDMPSNLSLTKLDTDLGQLSWSGSSPRYEVFYSLSGSDDIQSLVNTTDTTHSVTSGLTQGQTYEFFVVSYGNDGAPVLPSVNSSIVTLTLPSVNDLTATSTSNTITLTWIEPDTIPSNGYTATGQCHRLCEASSISSMSETSSTSLLVFSDVIPDSNCTISLIGHFGANIVTFDSGNVVITLSVAPTSSPENITFSSVKARSVIVSWDEVPCSGQNGPITGYLLYYTNTTFSDYGTINITGGENRSYTLTELRPYTNYTVTVSAYNDIGTGPISDNRTQQTEQAEPGVVSDLMSSGSDVDQISITWNQPSIPNGIIIMYDIRYRMSDNSYSFIFVNTTNTRHIIDGLIPNTSYTVGVRAYTIAGPGEWIYINDIAMTSDIPMVQNFQATRISGSTVRVTWQRIESDAVDRYTVYYYSTSEVKRQVDSGSKNFLANVSEGVIDGLDPNLDYIFSITVTFILGGIEYEGEETDPIMPSDETSIKSTNIGPIVGGVVGAILAVIVVIVIVTVVIVIVMRRKGANSKYYVEEKELSPTTMHFTRPEENENEEPKYEEVKSIMHRPPSLPEKSAGVAPVIQNFPNAMTVEEGQHVTFNAQVSGTPKPICTWYHEGNSIESDYAHEIHEDGSLVIFSAEIQHQGIYEFVAINSSGRVDQQVILNVVQEGTDEARKINCDMKHVKTGPIPVSKFGEFVAESHANSNKGFRSQYSMLVSGENEHPVTVAATATNKPLNRFANITVYDDNRIILKPLTGKPDCQNDYINASYIEGYSPEYKYIATQGPLNKTTVDFLCLVWQERPPIIVMVTNLKEDKKNKCQQYWPESGSTQIYGPFQVTLTNQQVYTDYTIRTLQLALPGSSEYVPHNITQYHFTSWPDHGVPEYATSILTFYIRIKAEYRPKRGPMLVHCSAGVGRTGTFITIDMVLQQIENEGIIDIPKIINGLRQQRMKMVQTVNQYVFIFDAILESVTCGDTQISVNDFRQTFKELNYCNPNTDMNEFQKQFEVLEQVTPKPDHVRRDIAIQFSQKNRSMDYAPSDKHRVPLKGEHPDYINAVFINGYKQKKAFIVAEGPMQSTCRAFWKMIMDRECHIIVMLGHLNENGRDVCYQYWPSTADVEMIGEYIVGLQNETPYNGYIERTLCVHNKKTSQNQTVIQYQITDWDSNGYTQNDQNIITIMEEMHKVQRKVGTSPILVHCSDTVTRSGIFCAAATIIEKCKSENIVDVFQVVKTQRINKPGSVPTPQHYQFIFELVITYLDSFELYANFQ